MNFDGRIDEVASQREIACKRTILVVRRQAAEAEMSATRIAASLRTSVIACPYPNLASEIHHRKLIRRGLGSRSGTSRQASFAPVASYLNSGV
ncbi:hypothetical protein NKI25_32850 [Mesorhizobium sp. M0808]|uniref:hypothetical protein n=1 Tax=Mesorhizobium sp. M0808 TaxID=2957002 RepID=UPI00333673FE